MLDKLISIAAMGDALTPLFTFIQDFRNRPSVGYNISVDSGWSAYVIRDLLQDAGVKIWGLTIFQDTITFRVRKAQAMYTQYLLERAGVPYVGGIIRHVASREEIPTPVRRRTLSSGEALHKGINKINCFVDRLGGL